MSEEVGVSLADAIDQLSAAVEHLESAAANRVSTGDLLLAGQLRDAQEKEARLSETNRVVGARLDVAIDKLRVLLEE